jgi:hypothetical protein
LTDDARDRDLHEFFQKRLVPAADALRGRGVEFFEAAPERGRHSYWNSRPPGESYIFAIGDDLAGELHSLWRGTPELQALADDLASMARMMAEHRTESADVSSFIYAMF